MSAPDILIIEEPTTDLVEELLGARGPQGIPGPKGDKGDKGDPATLAISGTGFLFSTSGVLAARGIAQADLPSLNLATLAATGLLALALQAAPTGAGFAHVTGGAWDGAARALVQADLPSLDLAALSATNALPLARVGAPTGSGLAHLTAGAWDSTAYALTQADLPSLNLAALTTTGALPIAKVAAPTSSGFPHITAGAWDAAARAIDLSTSDTTGTLALARVAAPSGSGFVTATGGAWGTARALVQGDLPSLNLATLTATNALPLARVGAPTSSGFAHVTSGAWDATARAIDLSSADTSGLLSIVRLAPPTAVGYDALAVYSTASGLFAMSALGDFGGSDIDSAGGVLFVQALSGRASDSIVHSNSNGITFDLANAVTIKNAQSTTAGAAANALTLKGSDGAARTGSGANQNGGRLDLQSGAAGTGASGTAGNPGAVRILAGATIMAQLAGLSTDTLKVGPSTGVVITPTAITINGVALGSGSSVTWAGDLLGSSSTTQTVVALRGASVPAAGALTTGNGLYVSGASALTYSALNLAGGAGYVTGTLPPGNLGSGTLTTGYVLTLQAGGAAAWAAAAGGSTATYETLAAWLVGSTPLYAQADVTTASATGALTTIRAQNATGTSATGGELRLQSGTGASAAGPVTMYAGTSKTLHASAVALGLYNSAVYFGNLGGTFNAVGLSGMTSGGAFAMTWDLAVASITLSQAPYGGASFVGQPFILQAQNATGTTSTGGELRLKSGTGTSTNGAVTLYAGATERARAETGGLAIGGGAGSYGGGVGVVYIKTAGTLPSSNPSGGGVLYVDAGALKYRGSSGTVTTVAAA